MDTLNCYVNFEQIGKSFVDEDGRIFRAYEAESYDGDIEYPIITFDEFGNQIGLPGILITEAECLEMMEFYFKAEN